MSDSKTPTEPQRVLPFEGAVNFRDLGGYKTQDGFTLRWGQLYRCGKLDQLSAESIEGVASLGIKTKIDLRYPEEVQAYPSPTAAFPIAENYVWQARTKSNQHKQRSWRDIVNLAGREGLRDVMKEKYVKYLQSHAHIFAEMLQQIAVAKTPLVFHCAAGKDRTGVAAAIILENLGVDRVVIMQDYMITQQQLGQKLENWAIGGAALESQYVELMNMVEHADYEDIKPLFDADEDYLNHCFAYIDSEYGDFKNYAIKELGLTDAVLQKIKGHLLEPSNA